MEEFYTSMGIDLYIKPLIVRMLALNVRPRDLGLALWSPNGPKNKLSGFKISNRRKRANRYATPGIPKFSDPTRAARTWVLARQRARDPARSGMFYYELRKAIRRYQGVRDEQSGANKLLLRTAKGT
jgi:hypothetical protein